MTATYLINRPNRTFLRETNAATGWLLLGQSGTGYATLAALIAAGDAPAPSSILPGPGFNSAGIQLTITNDGGAGVAGSAFYVVVNPRFAPAVVPEGIEIGSGGSYGPIEGPFYQIWINKSVSTDRLTLAFAY